MYIKNKRPVKPDGFTLMELLVVIAIIMMLVGILAPGLKNFKDHARRLKQKSNIRNAEIGLELYYERFKHYPDSAYVNVYGSSGKVVCGAQHLAEALVGRDERGFDPETKWHEADESLAALGVSLYDSDTSTTDGEDSMARRRGPYIEYRDTGAYLLEQLYDPTYLSAVTYNGKTLLSGDTASSDTDGSKRAPVITDVFSTRVDGMKVKVGTPIVYFRSNPKYSYHYDEDKDDFSTLTEDDIKKWRYNYYDNAWIFKLPYLKDPEDTGKRHLYDEAYTDPDTNKTGVQLFYEDITNYSANYPKPHNEHTYIIISAGTDGIFGTKDDVKNF